MPGVATLISVPRPINDLRVDRRASARHRADTGSGILHLEILAGGGGGLGPRSPPPAWRALEVARQRAGQRAGRFHQFQCELHLNVRSDIAPRRRKGGRRRLTSPQAGSASRSGSLDSRALRAASRKGFASELTLMWPSARANTLPMRS